jgi:hypothetical protein
MKKMNMVRLLFAGLLGLATLLSTVKEHAQNVSPPHPRTPVLVELFTSEGCSSCPPADALLRKLDEQPFPDVEIIALSEHVDYWNHDGWTDPYSSHAYTERQAAYGQQFRLESPYTPQMIVDGAKEFLGSAPDKAQEAFAQAASAAKIPVHITEAKLENGLIRAHVDADASPDHTKGEVYFVVALNQADSQVLKGENAGRRLTHVGVVRNMSRVGKLEAGRPFSRDVSVKLDKATDPSDLRVIVFVQQSGPGRVLGATMEKLPEKNQPKQAAATRRESEPQSSLARASLR